MPSVFFALLSGWRTMLVVPELEREVELLWGLRDSRKVTGCVLVFSIHILRYPGGLTHARCFKLS